MVTELGFIYALQNPHNGEIFYIGSTEQSLKMRLKSHYAHLSEYKSGKRKSNKRYEYLINLLPAKAAIILLKIVQNDDLDEWEKKFIKEMRQFYPNLTNMTDGGRGNHTSKYFTERQLEEYSSKISKSLKGKPKPIGFSENLSKKRKGLNNPGCRPIPNGGIVCLHPDKPKLFMHWFQVNEFCNSKHAGSNVRKYRSKTPYGYNWMYFNDCSEGIQDIVRSDYESSHRPAGVNL